MKRWLWIALCASALVGCGGGGGDAAPTNTGGNPPAPQPEHEWGKPHLVYGAPTYTYEMAQLSDGTVVAFTIEQPSGDLWLRRYGANGVQLAKYAVLVQGAGTPKIEINQARVIADGVGGALLAWMQQEQYPQTSEPYIDLRIARFHPTTGLSAPAVLQGRPDAIVQNHSLAVRADGSAMVSWVERQHTPATNDNSRAVFVSTFRPTQGWSASVQVSPVLEDFAASTSITTAAAAGRGRYVVAWTVAAENLNGRMLFARTANDNGVLGPQQTLFDGRGPVGSAGTAVWVHSLFLADDGSGIVFRQTSTDQNSPEPAFGYQRLAAGSGWSSYQPLLDQTAHVSISTAMNAAGKGFLALSYISVAVGSFDKQTFYPPVEMDIGSFAEEAVWPRIQIDADGAAVMIWQEWDRRSWAPALIKGSRYSPATGWDDTPSVLSSNAVTSGEAYLTNLRPGSAVVYWHEVQPNWSGAVTNVELLQFGMPL